MCENSDLSYPWLEQVLQDKPFRQRRKHMSSKSVSMRDRSINRRDILKAGTAISLGMAGFGAASAQAETSSTFVFANPSEYDTLGPHVGFDYSRVATRAHFLGGL